MIPKRLQQKSQNQDGLTTQKLSDYIGREFTHIGWNLKWKFPRSKKNEVAGTMEMA